MNTPYVTPLLTTAAVLVAMSLILGLIAWRLDHAGRTLMAARCRHTAILLLACALLCTGLALSLLGLLNH